MSAVWSPVGNCTFPLCFFFRYFHDVKAHIYWDGWQAAVCLSRPAIQKQSLASAMTRAWANRKHWSALSALHQSLLTSQRGVICLSADTHYYQPCLLPGCTSSCPVASCCVLCPLRGGLSIQAADTHFGLDPGTFTPTQHRVCFPKGYKYFQFQHQAQIFMCFLHMSWQRLIRINS